MDERMPVRRHLGGPSECGKVGANLPGKEGKDMTKTLRAALLLLAAAWPFQAAANITEVRQSIEASMLVKGTIEVDPQGRVDRFEIDQVDSIPAHARDLIDKVVPGWRFEPTLVEGKPAWVKTPMRLRLVATKVAGTDGAVALRVASASFGEPSALGANFDRYPTYPADAIRRGATATVFLVLRIDRDGRVQDVFTEQVNLRYLAREREMDRLRRMFAKSAERAATRWTFAPPADLAPGEASWSARVPVDFSISNQGEPPYGAWSSYVPGPRQQPEWLEEEDAGGDAYVAGGVYPVGLGDAGLRLLTPLGGAG